MPKSRQLERDRVNLLVKKGFMFAVITFVVGYFLLPIKPPKLPTVFDRLIYTLRWQTFSMLSLLLGIQKVARTRFSTTAIDPLRGGGEHHVILDSRYVQNTLEQLFLNVIGQLILCTYLTSAQLRLIPIFVFLFVIGRITFYIGYHRSYLDRAFGFFLTFFPTWLLYIMNVGFVIWNGPGCGFGLI